MKALRHWTAVLILSLTLVPVAGLAQKGGAPVYGPPLPPPKTNPAVSSQAVTFEGYTFYIYKPQQGPPPPPPPAAGGGLGHAWDPIRGPFDGYLPNFKNPAAGESEKLRTEAAEASRVAAEAEKQRLERLFPTRPGVPEPVETFRRGAEAVHAMSVQMDHAYQARHQTLENAKREMQEKAESGLTSAMGSLTLVQTRGTVPPAQKWLNAERGLEPPAEPTVTFRSAPGPEREGLERLYASFRGIAPSTFAGKTAKVIGIHSVDHADQALAGGDHEGYERYREVGVAVLDIALGFTPGVGFAKDLYEATTGKNLLTGEDIGTVGVAFAVLGVVTGGLGSKIEKVADTITTLRQAFRGSRVTEIAPAIDLVRQIDETSTLVKKFHPASGAGPLHKGLPDGRPPVSKSFYGESYSERESIKEFDLYRVYGDTSKELGRYYTRVKPTGPLQATYDAALSPEYGNSAKKWVKITVPAGTKIFEGLVAPVQFRGGSLIGGGHQVYLDLDVPEIWVTGRGEF